jgi:hypothetical protein
MSQAAVADTGPASPHPPVSSRLGRGQPVPR